MPETITPPPQERRRNLLTRVKNRRGVRQFVKFGIVGASGFAVNLLIFTLLQFTLHPAYWVKFSVGFMAGGVSNYFLNRVWTFRSTAHPGREGAQFLTVSFIALLIGNLVGYVLEHAGFHHEHTTWFLSTLAGMVWNFFANKYWTFRNTE